MANVPLLLRLRMARLAGDWTRVRAFLPLLLPFLNLCRWGRWLYLGCGEHRGGGEGEGGDAGEGDGQERGYVEGGGG